MNVFMPAAAAWKVVNPLANLMAVHSGAVSVFKNLGLAYKLANRDLASRYKSQIIGAAWIVAHPLLLMLIFLFIFGVVFKQRIGGTLDLPRDYTTYILSGLVPWLASVPVLTGTCNSILGSAHLVKQFSFDTTAIPLRDVVSSIYFWIVGLGFITLYTLVVERSLPFTYVYLPGLMALTFMFLCGIGWLFAAITVFFRDLKDIMVVAVTILVYILPIVYLPQWTPEMFQQAIALNPLSYLIWAFQDILYFGRIEHPAAWIVFPVMSVLVFAFGYRVFSRLRPYFGNVL